MRRRLLTAIALAWLAVATLEAVTFISDAFTDSNGTNLDAHSPGTGGTWVAHPVYFGTAHVQSNVLEHETSGTGALYYNDASLSSAEYIVEADLIHSGGDDSNSSMHLTARVHTTQETYYAAGWDGNSNVWTIYWAVNGSFDGAGTGDTLGAGTYRLKFVVSNAVKQLYVDGVLKHSTNDNTITAAGFAGLTTFGDGDLTIQRFDNYLVTDIPASGDCGNLLLVKVGC